MPPLASRAMHRRQALLASLFYSFIYRLRVFTKKKIALFLPGFTSFPILLLFFLLFSFALLVHLHEKIFFKVSNARRIFHTSGEFFFCKWFLFSINNSMEYLSENLIIIVKFELTCTSCRNLYNRKKIAFRGKYLFFFVNEVLFCGNNKRLHGFSFAKYYFICAKKLA